MITSVTMTRQAWMDVLRCFAILLVVLDHVTDQVNTGLAAPLVGVTAFNDAVSPFRMATLMFLSGMLLPKSLGKPRGDFIAGKLGGIGWPYVLWSFVLLGLIAVTSNLSGNTSVDAGTFLQVLYSPPTYLWYLAYLLVFYLVALVLKDVPVVRAALIPVALIASQFLVAEPQWQRMLFLFAFFLLGDLIARNRSILDRAISSPVVVSVAAVLATATAVVAGSGWLVRYQAVWAVGVAAGIVVLACAAQAVVSTPVGRWMGRYGRDSLIFYVTHWCALLIAYHVLARVGVENEWALLVLVLSAALGVGFAFVWMQRWRLPRYLFRIPLRFTAQPKIPERV